MRYEYMQIVSQSEWHVVNFQLMETRKVVHSVIRFAETYGCKDKDGRYCSEGAPGSVSELNIETSD